MGTDWQKVKRVLGEAVTRGSLAERKAYVEEACRGDAPLRTEVDKLLKAHDLAGAFLETPATPVPEVAAGVTPSPVEKAGDWIGPYKLLQQIGEGGCGVVYMAEQEQPIRRRVALKVIKLGMDTKAVIARFEAERQALALMDHANIARVLDAGATETGRPYFVMELVRGIKITQYCDQNQLSTKARLKLFIQVCHALQHAHQKGIIHRDIKPSNILVTLQDGHPVVKVIDFGIAKATEGRLTDKTLFTAFEQFIGTPAYMSPEQAGMNALDIDTRSDIYSMGVLLYELLTGHTPFEQRELVAAGLDEMRRIIREQEPPRPSTRLNTLAVIDQTTVAKCRQVEPPQLICLVKGDLDWIVMRCLEKDRARRYESANSLAEDVVRHLSHEPVVARPPSQVYLFRKLVQRNKAAFVAGGLVLVALAFGLAFSLWTLAKERVARRQALAAEEKWQAEALNARLNLYAADMAAADHAFRGENWGLARHLLEAHQPASGSDDLRGFEWHYLWAQTRGDQVGVLQAHSNVVTALAFSPDGHQLVSAGREGLLRIWDVQQRVLRSALTGPTGHVYAVAFSPDQKQLAVGAQDGVQLWNPETWTPAGRIPGAAFACVAYGRSSSLLAVGLSNVIWGAPTCGPAALWDTGRSRIVLGLTNCGGRIALSPDGQTLVTGNWEDEVKLWDVADGRLLHVITNMSRLIDLKVSPDGRFLGTLQWFDGPKLWSLPEGGGLGGLTGQTYRVRAIAFSPDSQLLAAAGSDQTIDLWETDTRRLRRRLRGAGAEIWALAFSPDGGLLASGDRDGQISLWDPTAPLSSGSVTGLVERLGTPTFSLSANGEAIAAQTSRGVGIWNTSNLQPRSATLDAEVPVGFGSGARELLTLGSPNRLVRWDVRTGQPAATVELAAAFNHVDDCRFSPTGQFMAYGGSNAFLHLADTRSGQLLATPRPHLTYVLAIDFTSDGKLLASSDRSGQAFLWDVPDLKPRGIFRGHKDYIRGLAFSPDGRQLATASADGSARLWSVPDCRELGALEAHNEDVIDAAFAPDGRTLATSSYDRTVRLWHLATLREMAILPHPDRVLRIVFSADGKFLVSMGADGVLRFWRASSPAQDKRSEVD